MAYCSKCGAIMHKDDIDKHQCTNVPTKGKEKIPTTTEKELANYEY